MRAIFPKLHNRMRGLLVPAFKRMARKRRPHCWMRQRPYVPRGMRHDIMAAAYSLGDTICGIYNFDSNERAILQACSRICHARCCFSPGCFHIGFGLSDASLCSVAHAPHWVEGLRVACGSRQYPTQSAGLCACGSPVCPSAIISPGGSAELLSRTVGRRAFGTASELPRMQVTGAVSIMLKGSCGPRPSSLLRVLGRNGQRTTPLAAPCTIVSDCTPTCDRMTIRMPSKPPRF
jgi:hypothetical protein